MIKAMSHKSQKDKKHCYQFFFQNASCIFPHKNSCYICNNYIFRRTLILTMYCQNFGQSLPVLILPQFTCFDFAHNFIMLFLKHNESIDCKMKTVLNVTKGFTNLFLYLIGLQITKWSLICVECSNKLTWNVP